MQQRARRRVVQRRCRLIQQPQRCGRSREAREVRDAFADAVIAKPKIGRLDAPSFDWLIEVGFKPEVYEELKRRGHDLTIADRMSTDFGRAQLIHRMEDGYLAASERRTDGQAVGF